MTDRPLKLLVIVITFIVLQVVAVNDRVLLRDVQVLTLYRGRMTAGRRGAPVNQLNCVGGSAKGRFEPQVVQCYNRGWDGNDVQWECKADMDNDYRFGEISVTCEGYDYPEDSYILQGSCGLEYTLDFTAEGSQRQKQSFGSQYGSESHSKQNRKGLFGLKFSDIIILAIIGAVIYTLYKAFLSGGNSGRNRPGGRGGGNDGGSDDGRPPPPGFQPPPPPYDDSWQKPQASAPPPPSYGWSDPSNTSNQQQYTNRQRQQPPHQDQAGVGGGGGPGFFTGLGAGGFLGYLFGRGTGTNTGYGGGYGYGNRNHGYGGYNDGGQWGRDTGFFGGGGSARWRGSGGSSGPSTSAAPSSSGTRTASGFGGTKRR